MSYTHKEAKDELNMTTAKAIRERDIEVLHTLAKQYKVMGDDELAEVLRNTAKKFDREEWAYDESINN